MDIVRFALILTGGILLVLWGFLKKDSEDLKKDQKNLSGLYNILFKDSTAVILWVGLVMFILGIYAKWF